MRQPEDIICYCNEITYQTILEAYNKGAKTAEAITEATDAGNSCGYCIETLEEIIKELT